MKSVKIFLPVLFFVFTISFAQTKMNMQRVDESALSAGESYPVDARPYLERFDKEHSVEIQKLLSVKSLKKTAWNFKEGDKYTWQAADLRTGKNNGFYQVASTCRAVGTHCIIFVQDSSWVDVNNKVNQTVVDSVKLAFDARTPANPNKGIYDTDVETFGNPSTGYDPKIIILLLDIRDGYKGIGGYVAGYFYSTAETVNNAHIYFLDSNPLPFLKQDGTINNDGLQTGMKTTAHEFQHMIHFNYISPAETFLNESWSLVAEVICGYSLNTQSYYNGETNHYLLDWRRDDNTLVLNDYSRAAKFGLYLYEQYGAPILKNYLANRVNGLTGIENILLNLSPPTDFKTTIGNWWVANYLNDKTVSPGLTKWGYNYSNIIKVTPTTIIDPNVTNANDAVYKLGARYLSFTSGKNFNINFNTSGSPSLKIKAIKTGVSSKVVEDVTPGVNYSVPDFGTTYNNVSFIVYNDNRNEFSQGPFAYSYTSSGTFENKPTEIAYDNTEPTGVYPWSVGDSVAVAFDGFPGTKLDSIKVALRTLSSINGGVWRKATSGSALFGKQLAVPITATGKTYVSGAYPTQWTNWVKVDLRNYNIDASTSFIVSFVIDGAYQSGVSTGPNRIMSTYQPSSNSLTYTTNNGVRKWYNFYVDSATPQDSLIVYLIRAYVSLPTGVNEVIELMPSTFKLAQNYPNPFNPSTVINYQLPVSGHVSLKVYDMLGREVTTLVDEFQNAGTHNSQFSILNSQLSSGIYFYTIRAGNFVQTKKMMLLK